MELTRRKGPGTIDKICDENGKNGFIKLVFRVVRVIGAIFIIFSTTWAGFELSKRLSERTRQLRMFRTALQSLEAEIMYGHTPLHEAARRLSTQMPKPIATCFEQFSLRLTTMETTVNVPGRRAYKRFGN